MLTFLLAVVGGTPQGAASAAPLPPTRQATATRAVHAPVLDGRDDDDVWKTAQPITDFQEFDPDEGKPARFPTMAKVAYDEHNFYVFIRAFDPEPQKILKILARRDVRPPTDQLKIVIDSYHDRRTGYEFAVSPGGVKRDYAIYNDGNEDEAWDGVWDVATTVDSLGWTAEFRIPLSQLRYANAPVHTFGFAIWRDIERFKERVSWPLYHRQQAGFASQLGEVTGIAGISSPRRLEATPYVVTKNVSIPASVGFDHDQRFTAGVDFKYGVTSNLTLDATVNPDFGQVEADPSVLNLSAFETFFQEKRPFFIEGANLLSFEVNCSVVNCQGEGLFYSRRIGRAPQLGDLYGDATSATATTILGAAKLTGRTPGGLSVGVLDAVTQRQSGIRNITIEPASNYGVLRMTQDLRNGETTVGLIATAVNRALDDSTHNLLRSSADVLGFNIRHRFLHMYQFQAAVTASRVGGSPQAMIATQEEAAHYYQRPDGPLRVDSTATSLSGSTQQVKFGKVAGFINFETSYQRITPGYEINDLGFLNRADWQDQATWASLNFQKPNAVFNRLFWNFNEWNDWTTAGLPLEHAVNTNAHTELRNHWWVHAGGTLGQLGTAFCDRNCTRGGPALRLDPYISPWVGIQGDQRAVVSPSVWMNYWHGDGGRSTFLNVQPGADFRIANRWTASAGVNFTRNKSDNQWFGNFADPVTPGVTHYTFAHLEQRTMSLLLRVNYTASPTLTLQIYASPFVSKGIYSNVRELNDPRARNYADRFRPYGDTTALQNNPGFDVKFFNSNTVLRWEYQPGSTLYLVWTQGRDDFDGVLGSRSFSGDFRQLFRAPANNTFLIKVSHWFDW
ncbi:MAG TPA: DUF5916 domain-containing protein [Gemmatimonadales bacterium]|nr:DUF5916 domain-containing protein [Gemmatimonadales bacterium]